MQAPHCLSCQILAGEQEAPGGILYENASWIVASRTTPIFVPGNLFLILKRHAEQLAELTSEEAASLGPLIQNMYAALAYLLHPVKMYVASYGEGVQHIHFHLIPRTLAMPVGNGAVFFSQQWRRLLYQLGIKQVACSEAETLQIIASVRQYLTAQVGEKQANL